QGHAATVRMHTLDHGRTGEGRDQDNSGIRDSRRGAHLEPTEGPPPPRRINGSPNLTHPGSRTADQKKSHYFLDNVTPRSRETWRPPSLPRWHRGAGSNVCI